MTSTISAANPGTLYRGLPGHRAPDRVLVQEPSGRIRPLPVITWYGPAGLSWGYDGNEPRNLALSLLAHALGEDVRCPGCRGTGWVVFLDDPGQPDPTPAVLAAPRCVPWTSDVDPHPDRVAACPSPRCINGLRPLPHEELVRDIVSCLTIGHSWTLSRNDLLAWLTRVGWTTASNDLTTVT